MLISIGKKCGGTRSLPESSQIGGFGAQRCQPDPQWCSPRCRGGSTGVYLHGGAPSPYPWCSAREAAAHPKNINIYYDIVDAGGQHYHCGGMRVGVGRAWWPPPPVCLRPRRRGGSLGAPGPPGYATSIDVEHGWFRQEGVMGGP